VTFARAIADLDARQPEHMPGPSLDRIRAVAELMDDPQLSYPTIHVTGTNGKTTIARAAATLACAQGLSTGLFTSPHLQTVLERLSICGVEITEEEFGEEWDHLVPFLQVVDGGEHGAVTYFEAVTALAFLWFADKPVALGVFEVGMGGSWDATNLVAGQVAVIGQVSLDHPELGSTVSEVATEKSGIIKPGASVIVREQPPEALHVIETRAAEVGAHVLLEYRDWEVVDRLPAVGGQSFGHRAIHGEIEDLFVPMFGDHAARNAAAGVVAVQALVGHELDPGTIASVLATMTVPGRLEVVGRGPLVILDGAHNPAGASALAGAMREFFTWQDLHLVIAVSENKDVAGIASALGPIADRVYVARNDSVRSASTARVAEAFGDAVPVSTFESVAAAIEAARAGAAAEDCVLVTGSLYTVADARRALGLASAAGVSKSWRSNPLSSS
jgi:dihydrofolate synthase/folylpolyglutamate synthase